MHIPRTAANESCGKFALFNPQITGGRSRRERYSHSSIHQPRREIIKKYELADKAPPVRPKRTQRTPQAQRRSAA